MTDASWFRDATQIVLPSGVVAGYREDLEQQFMITIVEENGTLRLIGSPAVIPQVHGWLIEHGIVDEE
jgi:hypothetical protein